MSSQVYDAGRIGRLRNTENRYLNSHDEIIPSGCIGNVPVIGLSVIPWVLNIEYRC